MITDLFDSPWKILIVAVVLIVLFGSRKLPQAARSLGQSMRILKTELHGLHVDEPASVAAPSAPAAPTDLELAPATVPAGPAHIETPQAQTSILQVQAAAGNGYGPRGGQGDSLARGPQEMG
jgi:sec-independent protein translocase protein TatA